MHTQKSQCKEKKHMKRATDTETEIEKSTKSTVALQYYNSIQNSNFARTAAIRMMMQKTSLSQREVPLVSPSVHQHPLVAVVVVVVVAAADVVALKVHVAPIPMPHHPQSLSEAAQLWTEDLQKQVDDDDDHHHHHHDEHHMMICACCCC
jgi:hypothetical protein